MLHTHSPAELTHYTLLTVKWLFEWLGTRVWTQRSECVCLCSRIYLFVGNEVPENLGNIYLEIFPQLEA